MLGGMRAGVMMNGSGLLDTLSCGYWNLSGWDRVGWV